jgi:hypothetical protein
MIGSKLAITKPEEDANNKINNKRKRAQRNS